MIALLIAIIASAGVAVGASSLGGGGGGGVGGSAAASVIVYNTGYASNNAEYYRTAEYDAQYGLDTINAAEAYASLADQGKEVAGNGVKIGIVDSGIQADHIEIAANLDSANSASYITGDASIVDGDGHGTHVASTAAGAKDGHGMHGVAYEADIVVARVLNDSGSGSVADVASGIDGVMALSSSGGVFPKTYRLYEDTSFPYNTCGGDLIGTYGTGTYGTTFNVSDLTPGGYCLEVTDANGCVTNSGVVVLNQAQVYYQYQVIRCANGLYSTMTSPHLLPYEFLGGLKAVKINDVCWQIDYYMGTTCTQGSVYLINGEYSGYYNACSSCESGGPGGGQQYI